MVDLTLTNTGEAGSVADRICVPQWVDFERVGLVTVTRLGEWEGRFAGFGLRAETHTNDVLTVGSND